MEFELELTSAKIQERQRKIGEIRRKRRFRLFLILLAVTFLIGFGIILYNSSFFEVKKVKVVGNRHLSRKEIFNLSRIPKNASLFTFPTTQIKKALLDVPWVKKAQVIRRFPNKVIIRVEERKPLALISFKDAYAYIDEESFVIQYRPDSQGINLPVIKDLRLEKLPVGKKVRTKSLSNALSCLTDLDPKLRSFVYLVSAPSVDKLTLFTNDGVEILYGKAENVSQKNYALKKILSENGKNIIFIDIRVASNPAVRRL